MVFENGVKNIQAEAYNGVHTIIKLGYEKILGLMADKEKEKKRSVHIILPSLAL